MNSPVGVDTYFISALDQIIDLFIMSYNSFIGFFALHYIAITRQPIAQTVESFVTEQ